MQSTHLATVIGVFHDASKAQEAVRALRQSGFTDAHIGVVSRHKEHANTTDKESKVAKGAAIGAGTVGGVAALWSLGISFGVIPVIGPILAAGPLAAALISAASGAAAGGVVGALTGLGVSAEDADYYQGELNSGRTLVTVHADDRADLAWDILLRHGAYTRETATASAR